MSTPPGARPRVGVDLGVLALPRTGMAEVAWWQARLVPPLAPEIDFVHVVPEGVEPPAEGANVRVARLAIGRFRGARLIAEQVSLPQVARRERLDLLHTPAFGPPVGWPGRKLLTVHDLAFRILPGTVPWKYRTYWNWAYGSAARSCSLAAVSEATKHDIVRLMKRPSEAIDVVPNGVDPAFTPGEPTVGDRRVLEGLGVRGPYLLSVGTLQPRKDLDTLLAAFALLPERDVRRQLVIAGGAGWGYPDIKETIRRHGVEGRVILAGYVAPDVLRTLYRGAALLLVASRYEGFCLPILEAMASGLAVAATDVSAIPEVAGGAALLAPPGDPRSLADAAGRLLDDEALRRERIALGFAQAARYTWDASARRLLAVYRRRLPDPRSAA
jgi:glycosyltransferase involved in cell wall biosynthesis